MFFSFVVLLLRLKTYIYVIEKRGKYTCNMVASGEISRADNQCSHKQFDHSAVALGVMSTANLYRTILGI